jgi:hypothetical protein
VIQLLRIHSRFLAIPLLAAALLATAGCGAWSGAEALYLPDLEAQAVTVHVEVSEQGFSPRDLVVPAGPSIQLVMRNRGNAEFHYQVVGLHANQILWLALDRDMTPLEGVTQEDHEEHHRKEFVDFRGTSPGGVTPSLVEVHAYAGKNAVDVLHFFALQPGKYEVVDPLHPELKGTFTVVAP